MTRILQCWQKGLWVRSKGSFLWTLKKEVAEVILVSIIRTHSRKTAHTYDLGHVPPKQSLKWGTSNRNCSQERPVREEGKDVRQQRNQLRSAQQRWLWRVPGEILVGNLLHGSPGCTEKSLVLASPRGMWISSSGQDGCQLPEGSPLKMLAVVSDSHTLKGGWGQGAKGAPGGKAQRLSSTGFYCMPLLWASPLTPGWQ